MNPGRLTCEFCKYATFSTKSNQRRHYRAQHKIEMPFSKGPLYKRIKRSLEQKERESWMQEMFLTQPSTSSTIQPPSPPRTDDAVSLSNLLDDNNDEIFRDVIKMCLTQPSTSSSGATTAQQNPSDGANKTTTSSTAAIAPTPIIQPPPIVEITEVLVLPPVDVPLYLAIYDGQDDFLIQEAQETGI
ncbi:hypothetical protein EVAR_91080_1 [Eumeta japonica]|uniref:Uncharacterized protein n=1 Tax=Eumeta variegata TaxID=151549 RepID=A0A4C1TMC9_EUMVA|nr:hypothetical protein EVAR_91080_1 [Eumeta japonica]